MATILMTITVLKFTKLHFCTSYIHLKSTNLHTTVCKLLIERDWIWFKVTFLALVRQKKKNTILLWYRKYTQRQKHNIIKENTGKTNFKLNFSFASNSTCIYLRVEVCIEGSNLSYFREMVYHWLIYIIFSSESQDSPAQFTNSSHIYKKYNRNV